MPHAMILLWMAIAFGLFMAWGVGANDVANAMGTSVGAKALTLRQAIIVASIFEFAGATLAGGHVTATIRSGIVNVALLNHQPEILILGMLAALLSAGVWLLVASYFGWPVSTTHTIVGAIVGFGCVAIGFNAVHWIAVFKITLSWILTPMIAGVIAYLLFLSIQKLILTNHDPVRAGKKFIPAYVFLMAFVMSLVTIKKGLKHLGLDLNYLDSIGLSLTISALISLLGYFLISKIKFDPKLDTSFRFNNIENIFGVLMIFTACAMAFAHGSNDVANAIGPLAAIYQTLHQFSQNTHVMAQAHVPVWILVLGGVGIVLGLVTYGYRVIATIGTKITELTPSRGFAAEIAAASTVIIASGTGLPVSTTQTLVGAIIGVGFARGLEAIKLSTVRNIFLSWVITLPAGALLAIGFFVLFRWIFAA